MVTIAQNVKTYVTQANMIKQCSEGCIQSFNALICSGWVFVFTDGSELTVERSGAIIDIN